MTPRSRKLPEEAPLEFETHVLPDVPTLAEAGAREFARTAAQAVADRGVFRVALSGGSTPRALYRRLTEKPYREAIDWRPVRFFWGDERPVAPEDGRSNYRMAKETLLDPLGIPPAQVFRMRGEEEPRRAAAEYARDLRDEFPEAEEVPRFDLVLLGLGPDGHTASLFPGTRALTEKRAWVASNYVTKLREWRLTLTYPVLNSARRVVFVVAGEEKRDPVAKILARGRGYRQLPASAVRPQSGSLLWLLDEAAASSGELYHGH